MSGLSEPTVNLTSVRAGLAIVERFRLAITDSSETYTIDQLSISGTSAVGDLSPDDLLALPANGHSARLEITGGSWKAIILFDGPTDPSLETIGPPEDAFRSDELPTVAAAVLNADTPSLLRLAASLRSHLRVTVRNNPAVTGSHWIHDLRTLEHQLRGPNWVAAVIALSEGPSDISVSEPTWTDPLKLGQFRLLGSERQQFLATPVASDASFRHTRVLGGRHPLPSPLLFADPQPVEQDELNSIAPNLRQAVLGIAQSLVWYWLSTSSAIGPDGSLDLLISGARVIGVSLSPSLVENVSADLSLYLWASGNDDPARLDATEQAISLAVSTQADIATAAGPALRTARSLYEITRRGAVAEAFATRRSARDSALSAARQAANTASEAAGKAIERSLVQTAAVVAVVISNRTEVISRAEAMLLLALVGVLAIVFFGVTRCFSLRSASHNLDAELKDLDQYREALSTDDLDTIRSAAAVSAARHDLQRAGRVVLGIYAVLLVIVVAALLLVADHPASDKQKSKLISPTSLTTSLTEATRVTGLRL